MEHVGFIGTGTMGGILARTVQKSRGGEGLFLTDHAPEKAEALALELGATATTNHHIAARCKFIFLGVKPQMMEEMLLDLAPVLAGRPDSFVLVSMAAALTCHTIQEMAQGDYPVIRVLPNTPCAVGEGVIQYCTLGVTPADCTLFEGMMAPAGLVDLIGENLCDAASAVSGSGPAFAYLFLEALADGGVACGLPREKALRYAAQTVRGAAQLVLESGQHPGLLKDQVCSPGGTTIQGVRALEQGGLRAAAMEAVLAAYRRSQELK